MTFHTRSFCCKYVFPLVCAAALCGPSLSAFGQPGPLTGFSFLRIEPSARAAALSGAFSAVYGEDINALFYNPALLNDQMHRAASFSYLNMLSDLSAGFLAYGREIEGVGAVGAGLRFLSWGDIQGADENGEPTEQFGASDAALTVGLGRAYSEQLHYGANVHFIYSSVEAYRASALAADLGVLYRLPDRQFTASASINNLGFTLNSLGAVQDELPLDVRVGLAKRLQYVPLLISVTGYNLHDIGNAAEDSKTFDRIMHHLALGGEFQFSEAFQVRFGYNHRRHEALKLKSRLDLAGFGMGFGIKVRRIGFDYAYNTWSSVGGLHQFTLRTVL